MSGQAPTGLSQGQELNDGSLTDEDIQSIREAEAEHQLKPVNGTLTRDFTLDKKFELLKNQRRRRVLRFLMNNGEQSTTGELAEHVAVLENGKGRVNDLTSKERKAAYVGLYQCHLPKMDDYGVIRFDQPRGRIELTERAYELEEYLEQDVEPRWSLRYLAIAATGGMLFAVTTLGQVPRLPTVIAAGTMLGVVALAVVQLARGHLTSQ